MHPLVSSLRTKQISYPKHHTYIYAKLACIPCAHAQNTEAEAFEQLDYALAHGVNFIDTAEL